MLRSKILPKDLKDLIFCKELSNKEAEFIQGGLQREQDAGISEKTCLEKRIENCKSDPDQHDKSFCDSKEGKNFFKLLCELFGDPQKVSNTIRLTTNQLLEVGQR